MREGKQHWPCYLKVGKYRLMMELSCKRKWDFVMNVMIKYYVIDVTVRLMKTKNSKLF